MEFKVLDPEHILRTAAVRIPGSLVDPMEFTGTISASDMYKVTCDPALLEDEGYVRNNPNLSNVAAMHAQIQRQMVGAKKRNRKFYGEYLVCGERGAIAGVPAIWLYSPKKLNVLEFDNGCAILAIPPEVLFCTIDGDTQLSARFERMQDLQPDTKIKVIIVHGVRIEEARQRFHDLNNNVGLNPVEKQRANDRDPSNRIVREICNSPAFKNKVTDARAISKGTNSAGMIVTRSALRLFVRGVVEGKPSISTAQKEVTNFHLYTDDASFFVLEAATAMAGLLKPYQGSIMNSVFSAATLWMCVGISMNSVLVSGQHELAGLMKKLSEIDWLKGRHWDGTFLKYNESTGMLTTIGGPKASGYQTLNAIMLEQDPYYKTIRRQQQEQKLHAVG
jgi:hypothetical protein